MILTEQVNHVQRAKELLNRPWNMLIGGKLTGALNGKTFDAYSPATNEFLAAVPAAQQEDVERAVEVAEEAFHKWKKTPVSERIKMVRQMIAVLEENAVDLAILDSIDSGNPLINMIGDVNLSCKQLDYYCGAVLEMKGSTIPSTLENWHLTRREPFGVVGRIIPFNHPLMFTASKIGAPILTGNTIVLKVPKLASLAPLYIAELIKDIFPPGVVNIISGDGRTAGDTLVRHPRVKRIALIGSVETGRQIQLSAAEVAIKQISLELGGKNPMIVFPDVDIDAAVAGAIRGMNFTWQGQSCGSTSRLFLHKDIHDEFVEKLKEQVEKIRVGYPLDPDTEMGCLISQSQLEKVEGYIKLAKEEGAHCLTGGERLTGPQFENGNFIQPTVFTNVTSDMRIAQEEIFGPVLSVLKWEDEDEVIKEANSVDYGLTGAVWTNDIHKAFKVVDQLETGFTWINGSSMHFSGVPYGGYKNSGLGSEESIEELYSYTQVKAVNIMLGQQ
jgi:betaine-aldehyde dehydrogenase